MKDGDHVVFVDAHGVEHEALVTTLFPGMGGDEPGVNVVYVQQDKAMHDSYGQQITRETSVVHQSAQPAHGMYWRKP